MRQRNHYRTLGVDKSATEDEIQDAFHMLARRYHPDVNPNPEASEHFKEISAAYDVLSDPTERAEYDRKVGVSSEFHTTKPYNRQANTGFDRASWEWRSQTTYNRDAETPWYHQAERTPITPRDRQALILFAVLTVALLTPFMCTVGEFVVGGLAPGLDLSGLNWLLVFLTIATVGGLGTVGWGLYLRRQTRCPRCQKAGGRETLRKEEMEVFQRDLPLDGLPPIPHVRYRLHNRCKHCGHQWISTRIERVWKGLFS